ncbi:MAG TPA: hypothetical protein VJB34_04970 [Bdellovibrionota bacterium]|nr:hypothetical protein [Bdellovibrionota bacterium]
MKRTLLSVLSALFLVITFVGCQDASGPMSSVDKGITDDYLSKTYGGETASVTQAQEPAVSSAYVYHFDVRDSGDQSADLSALNFLEILPYMLLSIDNMWQTSNLSYDLQEAVTAFFAQWNKAILENYSLELRMLESALTANHIHMRFELVDNKIQVLAYDGDVETFEGIYYKVHVSRSQELSERQVFEAIKLQGRDVVGNQAILRFGEIASNIAEPTAVTQPEASSDDPYGIVAGPGNYFVIIGKLAGLLDASGVQNSSIILAHIDKILLGAVDSSAVFAYAMSNGSELNLYTALNSALVVMGTDGSSFNLAFKDSVFAALGVIGSDIVALLEKSYAVLTDIEFSQLAISAIDLRAYITHVTNSQITIEGSQLSVNLENVSGSELAIRESTNLSFTSSDLLNSLIRISGDNLSVNMTARDSSATVVGSGSLTTWLNGATGLFNPKSGSTGIISMEQGSTGYFQYDGNFFANIGSDTSIVYDTNSSLSLDSLALSFSSLFTR